MPFNLTYEPSTFMRLMIERLKEEDLLINIKKCTFVKEEIVYLEFVISNEELKMDPKKVRAIVE